MTTNRPNHCCHEKGEACDYGWSDVHFHRCVPPETTHNGPATHARTEVAPRPTDDLAGPQFRPPVSALHPSLGRPPHGPGYWYTPASEVTEAD